MASSSDSMIPWILSELRNADVEGVPISTLFGHVHAVAGDKGVENAIWEALLQRNDIVLGDRNKDSNKDTPLNQSQLVDLNLDDVLNLDLGARRLFASRDSTTAAQSHAGLEGGILDLIEVAGTSTAVKRKPENDLKQPLPKRRGRPPIFTKVDATQAPNRTGSSRMLNTNKADGFGRASPSISSSVTAIPPSRSPPIGNKDTPHKRQSQARLRAINEAQYTPFEHLQYEAGESGVFIDPPGTEKPRKFYRGRKPLSKILVVKLDRLKDPTWLEKRKGTWVNAVAETIAGQVLHVQDNTPKPQRNRNYESKTRNKSKLSILREADNEREPSPSNKLRSVEATRPEKSSYENENASNTLELTGFRPAAGIIEVGRMSVTPAYHGGAMDGITSTVSEVVAESVLPMKSSSNAASGRTSAFLPQFPPQAMSRALLPPATKSQPLNNGSNKTPPCKPLNRQQSEVASQQHQTSASGLTPTSSNFVIPQVLGYISNTQPSTPSHSQQLRVVDHAAYPPTSTHNQPQTQLPAVAYLSPGVPCQDAGPKFGVTAPVYPPSTYSSNITEESLIPQVPNPKPLLNAEYISNFDRRAQVQTYKSPFAATSPLPNMDLTSETESAQHPTEINRFPQMHSFPSAPRHSTYDSMSSNPILIPSNPPSLMANSPSAIQTSISTLNPFEQSQIRIVRKPLEYNGFQTETIEEVGSSRGRGNLRSQNRTRSQTSMNESEDINRPVQGTPAKSQKKGPGRPRFWAKGEPDEVDYQFESVLKKAGIIPIPEGVTRLACMIEDRIGNLLLSDDKTALEFISFSQHPPQVPIMKVDISQITQNPITSVAGSKPMELRINVRDASGEEVVHRFVYAQTPLSCEAANNMRAKIVTALIAFQFRVGETYERPVEAQQSILKPFKCDRCGNRFKNKGGLEYHITKSNTTCNPNFDLEAFELKRSGKKRKISVAETSTTNRKPRRKSAPLKRFNYGGDEDEDFGNEEPVEDDSTDEKAVGGDYIDEGLAEQSEPSIAASEDSVVKWFRQNATARVEKPSTTSRVKRYKALPREASVLKGIADDASILADTTAKEIRPQANLPIASITSLLPDSGFEHDQAYESIFMAILNSNNEMFPGDRSIWIACVSIWLAKKKNSSAGATVAPESKVCSRVLDQLVADCKLALHEFKFLDRQKREIIRSIVLVPGIDLNSSRITALQELMKESHPEFYVPSQFAPPQPVLDKLQASATRSVPTARSRRKSDSLIETPRSSSFEFPDVPAIESDDEDEFMDFGVEPEARSEDESDFSGIEVEVLTSQSPKRPRRDRNEPDRSSRSRSVSHNKSISEGLRNYWSAVRQKGGKVHPYSSEPLRRPISTRQPKRSQTEEEKKRRARNMSLLQQSWSRAPSLMPNPVTGAWDQQFKLPSPPRTKVLRTRLPEPITFMQSENGSWSVRPFGHGVNPIYSRPSKRVVGSRSSEMYLQKIHSGFRPVIYPTRNMQHFPAPPSKAMMQSLGYVAVSTRNQKKRHREEVEAGSPNKIRELAAEGSINKKPKKPRRTYKSQIHDDENDETFVLGGSDDEESIRGLRRITRKPTVLDVYNDNDVEEILSPQPQTTAVVLKEVDILNFFEPKKLEAGAPRNPGLESLPSNFGVDGSQYDQQLSGYPEVYDELKFVDSKVIQDDSNLSGGSWTSPNAEFRSEDYNFRWDEHTAFTIENLPYVALNLQGDTDAFDQILESYNELELPPKKRRRAGRVSGMKTRESERVNFLRPITHLTTDFEGILDDPAEIMKLFNIQAAEPNETTKRRKRNMGETISQDREARFIFAVVIIRSLLGGVELQIDWVLIATLFQELSLHYMKKLWQQILSRKKAVIDRLVNDFQEAFLAAYEDGEIDALNYDRIVEYNWEKLIDWVMENVDSHLGNKPINIPGCKKELNKQYHLNVLDREDMSWRDSFYALNTAVYKRIEIAASEPSVTPVDKPSNSKLDGFTIAKSWVKSTAMTPLEDWSPKIAEQKLTSLGLALVEKCLDDLKESKIIMHIAKNRATPGRSYEATDAFMLGLRKHIREPQLVEAVTYKRYLDTEFRKGNVGIRADYFANEGAIMVIAILQAHGRVKLVPSGVPINKFGLTDGGYETRQIPRERLRWEMDIFPTDTYIYDDENEILSRALEAGPPRGNKEAIPIWFSISEIPNWGMWKKVILGVGQMLALRAGINVKELVRIFRPSLEEWEIKLVLDWGTEMGLWTRMSENVEGWVAAEWWWLAVGKWCVGV